MNIRQSVERVKALITQLMLSDALRAKAVRGGAWLASGSVAEQVVRFSRNILLARLLAPGAFGTMAIVVSSASLIQTLTDVGVGVAIIQNPRGDEKEYLNASWWLAMGRAILTYLVIFMAAPWIAQFYGRPELTGLLRVALLGGTLVSGAMSPQCFLAQRKLNFGVLAVITSGGGVCGVIFTVVLSFFIRDVWALAIGYASENVFRCILSYVLCPGLPSLRLDRPAARELLRFSKATAGLTFLNLLTNRADVFVLGKLYSSAALGLYSMAVMLVATPSSFITGLLSQAFFPALSRIQHDNTRVNRIFLEIHSWLVVLGLPAAVAISLCAPSILQVCYGTRYVAAAQPLSVAAAVILLTVLNAPATCVLLAKGHPAIHRESVAITAIIMIGAVYPASKNLGPVGGQVAALVSLAVGYGYQLFRLRSITSLDLLRYLNSFLPSVLASTATFAIILGARSLGLATRPATNLALGVVGCVIAYAISTSAQLRASKRREKLYAMPSAESVPIRQGSLS